MHQTHRYSFPYCVFLTVIGAWANTAGQILRGPYSYGHVIVGPLNIGLSLSGFPHYDHYQVSFANGHIKLSRFGNDTPLMEAINPSPKKVNYVGMWTGYGSNGYWIFPTFC